ncbi:MAG: N-6 DNA methylase [Candidatus Nitrotoga sp.]|nr:N-6 DNA methylase [Candidatus Nitrotoga sp.]
MLFIKYISDKYGNNDDFAPPVTIPKGASFKDMIALKGKPDIGVKINTQIIKPLIDANIRLARSGFPNFNDPEKLGEGAALVERLTNLIGIFQNPILDFSQNRAEHDDILGDVYEFLMRHFASELGKSKGQFYTPSEVSRVIAKVIGIAPGNTKAPTTAYDPTCGSGSLLLKVAAQAGKHITLEGQEKDVATAGLARMVPRTEIADPKNDYNLNLPRYIDSTAPEDLQDIDGHPKAMIETTAEALLATFKPAPLLDAYDIYQHLMDYWAETMQDGAYLIAADGWIKGAQPREIVQVKDKNYKLV